MPSGFISASKTFQRAMGNWYQTCRWEHQRWWSSYMIPQSLSGQREIRQSTLRTIPILAYYDQDKQLNFPQMLQRMVWVLSYCRQRETVGSQWHMLLDPWLMFHCYVYSSETSRVSQYTFNSSRDESNEHHWKRASCEHDSCVSASNWC